MLFHSRAASPGSLTAERRFVRGLVFQGRAKSPGSLTQDRLLLKQHGFRAVLNHLVLLRFNRGGIVYYGFMAMPNHFVLLHNRWCSRTGAGVSQLHRAIRALHVSASHRKRSRCFSGGRRSACSCLFRIGEHGNCFAAAPNHLVFDPMAERCRPSCFIAVPRLPSVLRVCIILSSNAVFRCVSLTLPVP